MDSHNQYRYSSIMFNTLSRYLCAISRSPCHMVSGSSYTSFFNLSTRFLNSSFFNSFLGIGEPHVPLFKHNSKLESTECVLFHILLDTTNNIRLHLSLLWCYLKTLRRDPVLSPRQWVIACCNVILRF